MRKKFSLLVKSMDEKFNLFKASKPYKEERRLPRYPIDDWISAEYKQYNR